MFLKTIHCTAFAALMLMGCVVGPNRASGGDLFTGTYVSESKENFGANEPGKIVIEVAKIEGGYTLTYSTGDKKLFTVDVEKCSEKNLKIEYYHSFAQPGEMQALCLKERSKSVQFFYAENGIQLPERMGGKIYKTKYYSDVQWSIYGFKKIK